MRLPSGSSLDSHPAPRYGNRPLVRPRRAGNQDDGSVSDEERAAEWEEALRSAQLGPCSLTATSTSPVNSVPNERISLVLELPSSDNEAAVNFMVIIR